MYWATFAEEPRPEVFKDALDALQNSPKPQCRVWVIRGVDIVLVERDWIRYFNWHPPDSDFNSARTSAGAQILVAPYQTKDRQAAMVQFPGGYIAEIHSKAKK